MIDDFITAVNKLAASMLPNHRWVLIVERKPGRFAIGAHASGKADVHSILRAVHSAHEMDLPS